MIETVVVFWAALLSRATTVKVLAPGASVRARDQDAVPEPVAVPPEAAAPLTVTDEMPLSPRPLSEAVPASVIEQALELDLLCLEQALGWPPLGAFELEENGEAGHAATRNGGGPGDVGKRAFERHDHGRSMQPIAAAYL